MLIKSLTNSISTLTLLFFFSPSAFGKGLDTLQANEAKPVSPDTATEGLRTLPDATQPAILNQAPPTSQPPATATPEEFAPEILYAAPSLSWINLSGNKGGWHSGSMSDLELGYRLLSLKDKFNIFVTYRFRPVDVSVVLDQRQYRGIIEGHLFGSKAKLALLPRLAVMASAELGFNVTHLNSIDSLPSVDKTLEKSGVDLNLGTGVSYLVLDKLGLGAKFAFGTGLFKTVQFGLEVRFLL